MLPLFLLYAAKGQPLLVELKSGDTINGTLNNCDVRMNITLDNVILSNSEGTIFEKRPEIYVHGTQIKGMRMSNEVIEKIQEPRNNENRRDNRARNNQGNNKGYNNNNNNRRRNYNNQDERRQRGGRDQRQQH